MLKRILVRANQLGLVFQNGALLDVLEPGTHWVVGRKDVLVKSILDTRFEHPDLKALVQHPALAPKLEVLDLQDGQRALVWVDGRLAQMLQPGLYAFWKQDRDLVAEVFPTDPVRFEHPRLDVVTRFDGWGQHLSLVDVEAHEAALFRIDGKLAFVAGPGRYAFWQGAAKVTWQAVDRREQMLDVAGQDIMTADKVTLRVNLVVGYQVTDAELFAGVAQDAGQTLYREAQLALRVAVGGRTLDALLADKEAVAVEVSASLAQRATDLGLVVRTTGLRDVILPGEMKSILNQVIEAQKRAEANLIQRREETAAARSQANTARLLADNPALARMKELEALQSILSGTKATFVLGQGDVLGQLREWTAPPAQQEGA